MTPVRECESDVAKLLSHAVAAVPRYRGMDLRLEAFPIVSKVDILSDLDAFLAEGLTQRAALVKALSASDLFHNERVSGDRVWQDGVVIEETTGTSGIPFRFVRTAAERARIATGVWRSRKGIDATVSPRKFYPFFHAPAGFRHAIDPLDCSSKNVIDLYKYLSERSISWIHLFPGLLLRHAEAIGAELPAGTSLKFAEVSGSFLTDEVVAAAKRNLRVDIVNQYGCMEVSVIGYGRDCCRFKVVDDNVLLEIVNEVGRPIRAEGEWGDVVVTGKHQYTLPFIRYRTGDRACWISQRVGSEFVLFDQNRDIEDKMRWGYWKSGARYFRTMLPRAYAKCGFVKIGFLQIRETGPSTFDLVVGPIPEGEKLRAALQEACREDPFIPGVQIALEVLKGEKFRLACSAKPRLFLPGQYRGMPFGEGDCNE